MVAFCTFHDRYNTFHDKILKYNLNDDIIVSYILYGGFFVAALIVMWKHRQEIKAYYQEHKVKMAQYMKFFVSAGMIAFTIIHILLTIVGIQPL